MCVRFEILSNCKITGSNLNDHRKVLTYSYDMYPLSMLTHTSRASVTVSDDFSFHFLRSAVKNPMSAQKNSQIHGLQTAHYINNSPTRCNTKQSLYYSASSLYMFRVSTTPIIRSAQNCNYSLRYWSAPNVAKLAWPLWEGGSCTKNTISTGGCSYSFVYSWWWVWLTPETCRVNLQNNK